MRKVTQIDSKLQNWIDALSMSDLYYFKGLMVDAFVKRSKPVEAVWLQVAVDFLARHGWKIERVEDAKTD